MRAVLLTANEWEYFVTSGEDLSGDQSAAVNKWLQPHLQEQDVEMVQQYHALVVESLKAQSAGAKGTREDGQQQQLNEQLVGLTPRLKALVGIESAAAGSALDS